MYLLVKIVIQHVNYRSILKTLLTLFVFIQFLAPNTVRAQIITIPNFWDPNERFVKPPTAKLGKLRFITTTDFPPFSFIGGEKQISGFHIDLARAICSELEKLSTCQIQAIPWSEHENAIKEDVNTVLISGLSVDSASRQKYRFTRSYITLPARFVGRKTNVVREPLYHNLSGKIIGTIAGTAHEAFLTSNFGQSKLQVFPDQNAALKALSNKEIEVFFAGALQISYWLHSQKSQNCCEFVGGPYLSAEYFGNGLAMAVNPKNKELLAALNYSLRAISDKGIFSELYLRYFPERLF